MNILLHCNWCIRRITEVKKMTFIYLNLIAAMVTKRADKIGINRKIAILDQILGFWRPFN